MSKESRIIAIVEDFMGYPTDTVVTLDSTLEHDLKLDSLDGLEIVMAIEDSFDVAIEDEECERWVTVRDIVNTPALEAFS